MPIALVAVVVVALAVVGVVVVKQNDEPAVESPATTREVEEETSTPAVVTEPDTEEPDAEPVDATPAEPVATEPEPETVSDSAYDDGTYTASVSYLTPARKTHELDVTLTINDDVVTAVRTLYDGGAAGTPSLTRFDGAYEAQVVGVALDNLSLSRVGGSSLTTEAFNDAVASIKQQAS